METFSSIPVERLPEQTWLLKNCVQADQRDQLARFWLAAPEDLLPSLWSSPVGEATKSMVRALTPQTSFTPDQVATRDAIGARLQAGFQAPMAIQLLLANFLYSPPGLLTIANAEKQLPQWLISDYQELYSVAGSASSSSAVAPPQQAPTPQQQASVTPATMPPQPDFGQFPDTLQELVGNRIQLNRLLGLSNLYYIDPEDQEILQELRDVRLALISAIERCAEDQLESIWASDLGDRYWALVRSGVQKEPMTPVEEQKKHAATQKLNPSVGGGFGTPGAVNAVLVAMTLFEPGTMRIDTPEQKLPGWLLANYQQIFAEPLSQQV